MNTRTTYNTLLEELEAIEKKTGLYLSDEMVDRENVSDAGFVEESDGFWAAMFNSACGSAGMRAEEAGRSINELIGRTIY